MNSSGHSSFGGIGEFGWKHRGLSLIFYGTTTDKLNKGNCGEKSLDVPVRNTRRRRVFVCSRGTLVSRCRGFVVAARFALS